MVWVVPFEPFKSFLDSEGFVFIGVAEAHRTYVRPDGTVLVVKAGDPPGPFPEIEMIRACEAAGIVPPDIQPFFGSP